MTMMKVNEQKTAWEERRSKVEQDKEDREQKSWQEYRRAVAQSKRRLKKEIDGSIPMQTQQQAR